MRNLANPQYLHTLLMADSVTVPEARRRTSAGLGRSGRKVAVQIADTLGGTCYASVLTRQTIYCTTEYCTTVAARSNLLSGGLCATADCSDAVSAAGPAHCKSEISVDDRHISQLHSRPPGLAAEIISWIIIHWQPVISVV